MKFYASTVIFPPSGVPREQSGQTRISLNQSPLEISGWVRLNIIHLSFHGLLREIIGHCLILSRNIHFRSILRLVQFLTLKRAKLNGISAQRSGTLEFLSLLSRIFATLLAVNMYTNSISLLAKYYSLLFIFRGACWPNFVSYLPSTKISFDDIMKNAPITFSVVTN